eukprot:GFYU01006049.1.p1 GENE.GFYU01006049.1~~GFYU01006049.1.p1  ORF type:complete len:750 (+),score=171.40 GFYU01006049.1:63-2312(+)
MVSPRPHYRRPGMRPMQWYVIGVMVMGMLAITSYLVSTGTTPPVITDPGPPRKGPPNYYTSSKYIKNTRIPNQRFAVEKNAFPAAKAPATADITLVTALTVRELDILEATADRWHGPISAAVLLRAGEEQTDLVALKRKCSSSDSFRDFVSFHLVYEDYPRKFPINAMRNVGISAVATDAMLVLDVEMITSKSMAEFKVAYNKVQPKRDSGASVAAASPSSSSGRVTKTGDELSPVLAVIPAFESDLLHEELQEKDELASGFQSLKIRPAALLSCLLCQKATNYDKWFDAVDPYEVYYEWFYSPVVIGPKDMVMYDERFEGSGYHKTSHELEMVMAGHRYIVIDDLFVIQTPNDPNRYDTLGGLPSDPTRNELLHGQLQAQFFINRLRTTYDGDIEDEAPGGSRRKALQSTRKNLCFYHSHQVRATVTHDGFYTMYFFDENWSYTHFKLELENSFGQFVNIKMALHHWPEYAIIQSDQDLRTVVTIVKALDTKSVRIHLDMEIGGRKPQWFRDTGRHSALAGQALLLSGKQHLVMEVADYPAYSTNVALTVEMWVFALGIWEDPKTMQAYLFALGSDFYITVGCFGDVQYFYGGEIVARGKLNTNVWTHVAAVADPERGTFALYVNGFLAQTTTQQLSTPSKSWSRFFVGVDGVDKPGTQHFNGIVDEIRVWNTVREQQQLRDMMVTKTDGKDVGVIGYWSADEGTGMTVQDASYASIPAFLGGKDSPASSRPKWVVSSAPITRVKTES